MTVENISWSTKECCRPQHGLNPRPSGLQSDGASNWATKAGNISKERGDWQWHAMKSFLWSFSLFRWFKKGSCQLLTESEYFTGKHFYFFHISAQNRLWVLVRTAYSVYIFLHQESIYILTSRSMNFIRHVYFGEWISLDVSPVNILINDLVQKIKVFSRKINSANSMHFDTWFFIPQTDEVCAWW